MKILKYGLLAGSVLILTGCVGQPSIAKIDDNEAFKYVKQYEEEYGQIKSHATNIIKPVKWIQAANKKEPCKLFVEIGLGEDRTLKDGYKIFWDGKCKNGYAYGLGREFEKGFLTDLEAIALYSGEEKEPEYFIEKNNLANISMEGDITNGDFVETAIIDDGIKFDIKYEYGHFLRNPTDIQLFINSSPFSTQVAYIKEYPNFVYVIGDLSNDEFNNNNYNYNMIDKKRKQLNGFVFSVTKNNIRYSSEQNFGQTVRRVDLPQSYLNHMSTTFSQIKNAGQVAIDAQKKALMVKQQYKDAICKDSIKVDFMDNNEYKAICNENEKFAQLKTKIDAKLAQINQEKQLKRAKMGQERLIQAQEAQARAAQQQASAARAQANAVQQRADDSYWSDFNTNMQLMQLNNNLMKLK